jgi:hypothetical protein
MTAAFPISSSLTVPLRSCGVRQFSHGQRQGGGPALDEEMLRQSRRHAEMIERERGRLVVNPARAAPKPGPFAKNLAGRGVT